MATRREFIQSILIGGGIATVSTQTRALQMLMQSRPKLLPKRWAFYEAAGQVLFPMYGASGGLVASYYSCLIQRSGKDWYAIPVEFTHTEVEGMFAKRDAENLVRSKLMDAIENVKPMKVDMDGGGLPRAGRK